MRMLARVEGMPLEALEQGVPWDWRTTAEYLDRLDGTLAINTGFMVGHSALRRVVMGEAATERAAPMTSSPRCKPCCARGWRPAVSASRRPGRPPTTTPRVGRCRRGMPAPKRSSRWQPSAASLREPRWSSFPWPVVPSTTDVSELMIRMTVAAQRPLNWNIMSVHGQESARLARQARGERPRARARRQDRRPGHPEQLRRPGSPSGPGSCSMRCPVGASRWPCRQRPSSPCCATPSSAADLAELAARPSPMGHLADWGSKLIVETFSRATSATRAAWSSDIAAEQGKEPVRRAARHRRAPTTCARRSATRPTSRPSRTGGPGRRCGRDPRAVVGASDAGAHLDMLDTFSFATVLLEHGVRRQQVLLARGGRPPADVGAGRPLRTPRPRSPRPGAMADVVVFDEATVASRPTETAGRPAGRSGAPVRGGRRYRPGARRRTGDRRRGPIHRRPAGTDAAFRPGHPDSEPELTDQAASS